MKTIGHISKDFLELTQTFIYQQIMRNDQYRHAVFAQTIMNEKLYPVEKLVTVASQQDLTEALKEQNIDLLHAHFGPNGLYALEAKKELGIPMVTFFHGWDVRKYPNKRSKYKQYEELFHDGEAFAVPSNAIKRELIGLGCPEHKIFVCYLGVDVRRFAFTTRTLGSGPIRLVSVGRLVDKKGHHQLIEALSYVEEKIPDFHLSIIGDGEQYQHLRELIRQYGLTSKVSLLGALAPDEVLDELRRAHLFCLASLRCEDGNMEGLPISILEAQATGLPVVSTRHSGIPEAVVEGKSALLAEENNPRSLADTLVALMSQPGRWGEFGTAGREWVVQNFNADTQMDALIALYDSLLRSE